MRTIKRKPYVSADPFFKKAMKNPKLKILYECNSLSFSKPPAKELAGIKKRAEAMCSGKVKSVPLSDVIKKLERFKGSVFRYGA
jgi:hypothetical protein